MPQSVPTTTLEYTIAFKPCCAPTDGFFNDLIKHESIRAWRPIQNGKKKQITFTLHLNADREKIQQYVSQKIEDASMLFEDLGFVSVATAQPIWSNMKLVKGLLMSLSGLAVMLVCMSTLPMWLMGVVGGLSTVATLYFGWPTYRTAWAGLIRRKAMGMETLFAISTGLVLVISLLSLFWPGLPMLFETGLMIFGLRHIGEAIEDSISSLIKSGSDLCERVPHTIQLLPRKEEADLNQNNSNFPVENLKPGDWISVAPGGIIPVDGISESTACQVYTTLEDGETLPSSISQGRFLLAGMRVATTSPPLILRVTQTSKNSHLKTLSDRLTEAQRHKTEIEGTVQEILKWFVPIVLIIAAFSAIVVGTLWGPVLGIQCAISVLVSACPCTFAFIAPLAVKIGMAKAFKHHVLFTRSEYIEKAKQIDTVVFDLTGTLTTGQPEILADGLVKTSDLLSQEDFQTILARLEEKSDHPIAKAIREFLFKKDKNPAWRLSEEKEENVHVQSGIKATLYKTKNDSERTSFDCLLGNETMMADEKIDIQAYQPKNLGPDQEAIYLVIDRQVMGYVVVQYSLREDAQETVATLIQMGKKVHLCTGARPTLAQHYAKILGISSENVFADCRPPSSTTHKNVKSDYIKKLQENDEKSPTHVAMIGDGLNDLEALNQSNLGIAMLASGSDIATQDNAQVLIQSTSLRPLIAMFQIAENTVWNIKQNLTLSIIYNVGVLLFGCGCLLCAGFCLSPVVGVTLMVLQSCLVLLNAYRFQQQPLPCEKMAESASLRNDVRTETDLISVKKLSLFRWLFENSRHTNPQLIEEKTAEKDSPYEDSLSSVMGQSGKFSI